MGIRCSPSIFGGRRHRDRPNRRHGRFSLRRFGPRLALVHDGPGPILDPRGRGFRRGRAAGRRRMRLKRRLVRSPRGESLSEPRFFGTVPGVEILYEHPGVVAGFREPVFVCWWRQTPALPQTQQMMDSFVAKATSTPGGIVFLVITDTSIGIPDRAAADVLSKGTRAAEKHILAHGFVIEGTGFKAGAIRTSVKTIQSLARVSSPGPSPPRSTRARFGSRKRRASSMKTRGAGAHRRHPRDARVAAEEVKTGPRSRRCAWVAKAAQGARRPIERSHCLREPRDFRPLRAVGIALARARARVLRPVATTPFEENRPCRGRRD